MSRYYNSAGMGQIDSWPTVYGREDLQPGDLTDSLISVVATAPVLTYFRFPWNLLGVVPTTEIQSRNFFITVFSLIL